MGKISKFVDLKRNEDEKNYINFEEGFLGEKFGSRERTKGYKHYDHINSSVKSDSQYYEISPK